MHLGFYAVSGQGVFGHLTHSLRPKAPLNSDPESDPEPIGLRLGEAADGYDDFGRRIAQRDGDKKTRAQAVGRAWLA